MATKRKKSEDRKEEIFETALKIIYKEGNKSLTTRHIAEQVGISEPAIYRHFDSKKDILLQLAQKVFSQDHLDVEEKSFSEPTRFLEFLIKSIFSDLEKNPYSIAFLFNEELFTEYPELRKMFQEHREKKMGKIVEVVRNAQETGKVLEDVDPETFAKIFTGSIRISVLEWRGKDFSYSLETKAEDLAVELSKILKKDS